MIHLNFNSACNHVKHICLLTVLLMMHLFKAALSKGIDIDKTLRDHDIIPDIIDEAPKYIIDVAYRNNVLIEMGNKVDPAEMQWMPKVKWPFRSGALYTLMMVDPDVPVRKNPTMAQRQHWIVGNIPNCITRRGETITGYIGPISPRNSGLHRSTFLVYEQKGRINFTEPRYSSQERLGFQRHRFSNRKFAMKYNLELFAVNFVRVGWPLYDRVKPHRPINNPFRAHFSTAMPNRYDSVTSENQDNSNNHKPVTSENQYVSNDHKPVTSSNQHGPSSQEPVTSEFQYDPNHHKPVTTENQYDQLKT